MRKVSIASIDPHHGLRPATKGDYPMLDTYSKSRLDDMQRRDRPDRDRQQFRRGFIAWPLAVFLVFITLCFGKTQAHAAQIVGTRQALQQCSLLEGVRARCGRRCSNDGFGISVVVPQRDPYLLVGRMRQRFSKENPAFKVAASRYIVPHYRNIESAFPQIDGKSFFRIIRPENVVTDTKGKGFRPRPIRCGSAFHGVAIKHDCGILPIDDFDVRHEIDGTQFLRGRYMRNNNGHKRGSAEGNPILNSEFRFWCCGDPLCAPNPILSLSCARQNDQDEAHNSYPQSGRAVAAKPSRGSYAEAQKTETGSPSDEVHVFTFKNIEWAMFLGFALGIGGSLILFFWWSARHGERES
jgi:hypothetical protein